MKGPLTLLGILALAGCGGGGSSPTEGRSSDTLVGTWTGTYGVAGSDRRGMVTLVVSTDFIITGTVTDPDGVPGKVVAGVFRADFPTPDPFGDFNFKFDDPGTKDIESSVTQAGYASLDARAHLIITHQGPHTTGNVVSQDDFDLTRVRS